MIARLHACGSRLSGLGDNERVTARVSGLPGGRSVLIVTNPVIHFEILGRDGPALIDFYRNLFGWELQDRPLPGWPHYALLRANAGISGAIGTADIAGPAVVVYVEVDDPDGYVHKAKQLGATVVMPVTHVAAAEVTVAWLRDPQGNLIGVVQSHETH
jgi:uncharacterized protein